jgi:acyl-CoA thioesterase-2
LDASHWLLLDQESPVAREGRGYGRAHVFTVDGDLVASFVQENLIRAFATDQPRPSGGRAAH